MKFIRFWFEDTIDDDIHFDYAAEIETSYDTLVKVLSAPNGEADDYKVTTEWRFKAQKDLFGQEIGRLKLQDWKATQRFDPELPPISVFRQRSVYTWRIMSTDMALAQEFKTWLQEAIDLEGGY